MTGPARFSWNPGSFEVASSEVQSARAKVDPHGAELAQVMQHVIAWEGQRSELGGLECPPPPNDPDGTYRVGLNVNGQPEIQRLNESGEWVPVTL